MPKVELPDGTIEHFPDDMRLEDIEAVLQARFPPDEPESVCQLPEQLEPGETYRRENGATITHLDEIGRYVVRDARGTAQGFRSTFSAAIALAGSIKPSPPPRRKPAKPPPRKTEQLMTHAAWNDEIDRHIRKQGSERRREWFAAQREKRFRNRGTLG
jgi:hypothetical protein